MHLHETKTKMVLSIAGSDPSGGAGIQADLKTFTAIGVYGGAVITCLTAQNTTEVFSYQPVEPAMVRKQIELVLEDMAVTHIKIGMVGTAEIAVSIGEALADYDGEVIYDPVLHASTGRSLMDNTGSATLYEQVVNRATVLTPNIPELSEFTQKKIATKEALREATLQLFDRFRRLRAIIVKGGHQDMRENTVTDYLIRRKATDNGGRQPKIDVLPESHPRIVTNNDHGTGCTFASAFTAFHLLTGNDLEAFRKTISFMDELLTLSASIPIGHGHGPLIHHLITDQKSGC